jgi:hypothetical protein
MKTSSFNNRDATLAVKLDTEVLEPVIAPSFGQNHNETLFAGPVQFDAEELEPVIAPGLNSNHNETFVV